MNAREGKGDHLMSLLRAVYMGFLLSSFRPDIFSVLDWTLKIKYQSIYPLVQLFLSQHDVRYSIIIVLVSLSV